MILFSSGEIGFNMEHVFSKIIITFPINSIMCFEVVRRMTVCTHLIPPVFMTILNPALAALGIPTPNK